MTDRYRDEHAPQPPGRVEIIPAGIAGGDLAEIQGRFSWNPRITALEEQNKKFRELLLECMQQIQKDSNYSPPFIWNKVRLALAEPAP